MTSRERTSDRLSAAARQIGYGVISSYHDYRAMFTWQSWAGGWLLRLTCQVLFFATLGSLMADPGAEAYIALGNAAALGPLGTLGVVSSSVGERRSGTLQYLLVSRANPLLVIASRGLYWVADGIITSCAVLTIMSVLIPGTVHSGALPGILAIEVLLALCAYSMSLTLASLSLRRPGSRMYLTASTTIIILALAGVNTPPPAGGPWGVIGQLLPVRHGLQAIRELAAGRPLPMALVAGELAVALGWAVLAYTGLTLTLRRSTRSGALSLS
ncbi:ABC transporter permease [Streptomyces sp. NPDC054765]